MRIKKYLMALALGLTMLCPTAVQAQRMQINFGPNSPLRKLQIAEMAINNLYVDSVNEQKLVEDGIRGMLEKLDPHSSYSSAKEAKALSESLNGSFEGIGVQFNIQSDTLLVIQPVSKGPSEKVGIMAGDRIVSVNDTAIAGVKMPQEEIMKRLRGPKGTHVKLGIVRRGIAGTLFFDVVRDKIPVKTLDAFYMIKPHVGYIRIGSFGATTYDEFMTAVNTLKGQGMKDLILDFEENGGGYLNAAVGSKYRFNMFMGYMKNLGAGKDLYDFGTAQAARYLIFMKGGDNFTHLNSVWRFAPSLSYNLPHFNLGIEYEWTACTFGDQASNGKGLHNDNLHMVQNQRVCLLVKYNF